MTDSSDEEAPEQVSFKTAKSAVEKEQYLVNLQKENDKKVAKLKRKLQQEAFLTQKQEKEAKIKKKEEMESQTLLDELRAEMASRDQPITTEPLQVATPTLEKVKKSKKVYKKLNIEVKTLSGVGSDRAVTAADFRDKRYSKAHRESVNVNLIHTEKLSAAGKL